MSETVLILGGTSAIGRAIAGRLASDGARLILAGRREAELEATASDLRVRHGTETAVEPFDALDFDSHAALLSRAAGRFAGGLDGLVLCHGELVEQNDAARDFRLARRMIDVNFTSSVSILNRTAELFEARRGGWICAISSVAGDRGRPSNFIYGATKGALNVYLQGLRARLAKAGVACVNVKPGFVDTRMTYGRAGLFLVAAPERVAADAVRGIRRNRAVVYTPFFWRAIMAIIRMIPDRIFVRLNL